MKHLRQFVVAVLLCALWAVACRPQTPQSILVGEQAGGKTIQVPSGSTIQVMLDGNPTTGYTWEAVSVDNAILSQVGEPSFTPDSSAIGSGGKMTLNFRTTGPGQTTLQLIYHQPFESGQPPAKTFEVTIVVK